MIVLLRSETDAIPHIVRTDLVADLPQVMGDRVQLQQVLMNLMINGIDAMKDAEGRANSPSSRSARRTRQLLMSVSDTGVGLPPQQADTDLQCVLYHQASRDRHGTSISRSIVESHGGACGLPTTLPAAQVFYFSLPTNAEAPE